MLDPAFDPIPLQNVMASSLAHATPSTKFHKNCPGSFFA